MHLNSINFSKNKISEILIELSQDKDIFNNFINIDEAKTLANVYTIEQLKSTIDLMSIKEYKSHKDYRIFFDIIMQEYQTRTAAKSI